MPVQLLTSIDAMQSTSRQWQRAGQRIAFVPTMGNLHAGHLQLVQVARENADRVVVSIFVNPLQFGPGEDFAKYPRTREADIAKLETLAVDAVFAPEEGQFYSKDKGLTTFVEVPVLSDILCGAFRPGHFRGVTTVVNKLFNIVRPEVAVFGSKDFQQFTIIQQMVLDLAMPVKLLGVETVREPDGLAMSSRNAYLSKEHRALAPALYQSLVDIRQRILAGDNNVSTLEHAAKQQLGDKGFRVDYLEVCDAGTLARPQNSTNEQVILAAVWLGNTRLIDNIRI